MKNMVKGLTGLAACMGMSCLSWGQTSDWVSLKTSALGLDSATAFCLYVTDINNDQYPDVVAVTGGWGTAAENPLRVYLNVQDTSPDNSGGRMFVDVTASSGVNAKPGNVAPSRGTLVVALADVNNDGKVDMVRGNYYHRLGSFTDQGDRCEVLLGDGLGHFSLVAGNGLHDLGLINTMGFSFLDYDKDGNIDLFIAPWFKDYDNNIWEPGYLMKGNGDGTFRNVSAQAGITQQEPMYGSSVVDWNNDGWPDIATAPYCRTSGQLWKNNGNGAFTNVAGDVGYNAQYMPGDNGQPLCMWGNVPEDYDNDGDMDFFFNLVHGGSGANEGRSTIMLNGGAANGYRLTPDRSRTQRKWQQSSHLGDYDGSWVDVDNDGLMDLVMTQGHYDPPRDRIYVFRQGSDHILTDITLELGLTGAEQRDLHRVEAIDYDLDGDDDILYCRNGAPREMHMLENRIGQENNWTGIQLRAPEGVNGSCIGARVYVWSGGKQRMREVYAGRGNGAGQQPFMMLFGLGSSSQIDSIRVVWPDRSGSVTTIVNPPVNQYLGITVNGLSVADGDQNTVQQDKVFVYPNPAKDYLLIQGVDARGAVSLETHDMLGRRIVNKMRFDHVSGTLYYPVKNLLPGQYILKGMSKDGKSFSRTFVKSE
jgi:hypothetical protein